MSNPRPIAGCDLIRNLIREGVVPETTRSISIRAALDSPVSIDVEIVPSPGKVEVLTAWLRQFVVVNTPAKGNI